MKCGSYIAGAGMDEVEVIDALTQASTVNGLVADDGPASVAASIRSGLRNGKTRPRAVPDPASPAPGVTSLADVLTATQRLHHVADDGPLRFALGVAVSSVLDQEPLWGMHVGPPSSGKTVTQEVLGDIADDQVDELTVAGLLTWSKGGKRGAAARPVGLLPRIGERGFATIGDFSTILAGSDRNGRDQLFGDLRRIYDGSFSRNMDSPDGQPLRWAGRLTLLAAVTPEIDRYSSHTDALGPRWLYIRTDAASTEDKRAAARKARRRHQAAEDRKIIRAAGSALVARARTKVADVDLSDDAHEALDDAALVACWGRASVPRQTWGRRDVDGVAVVEEPPRLVRQLGTLARCLVALGDHERDAVDLARRCALDTVPAARRDCLRYLADGVEATVSQIARRTRHHRDVIRRALEDMQIVGLTTCPIREEADVDQDDPPNRTAPAPWRLHGDDGELAAAVLNEHRRAQKRASNLPQEVGTPPPTPPSKGKEAHEQPTFCGKPDAPDQADPDSHVSGSESNTSTASDVRKDDFGPAGPGLSVVSRENASFETYVEPRSSRSNGLDNTEVTESDTSADSVCDVCGAFLFFPAPGETTCHRCLAGPAGPVHCIECDVQLTPERADCNIRCHPCWERLLANQPAYTGRAAS